MLSFFFFLSIFSLLLVAVIIIGRKIPYLKKLPLTETEMKKLASDQVVGSASFLSFLVEFFPELARHKQKFNWRTYQKVFLQETEKLLRRLKVSFLKLERWTNLLINKMQTNGRLRQHPHQEIAEIEVERLNEKLINSQKGKHRLANGLTESELTETNGHLADDRQKEQALIISIARDPKNPELYRQLGEIYFSLNNVTDAIQSWRTVLKLDPEDKRTRRKLEKIEKSSLSL